MCDIVVAFPFSLCHTSPCVEVFRGCEAVCVCVCVQCVCVQCVCVCVCAVCVPPSYGLFDFLY